MPERYGSEFRWVRFDVAEKLGFQESDYYFGFLVWHLLGNTGVRNQWMTGRAVAVIVDGLHISPR